MRIIWNRNTRCVGRTPSFSCLFVAYFASLSAVGLNSGVWYGEKWTEKDPKGGCCGLIEIITTPEFTWKCWVKRWKNIKIANIPSEIRTEHLPIMYQERCCYSKQFVCNIKTGVYTCICFLVASKVFYGGGQGEALYHCCSHRNRISSCLPVFCRANRFLEGDRPRSCWAWVPCPQWNQPCTALPALQTPASYET